MRALLLGLHVPAERERLLRILSGRTRGVVMQVQLVKTVAFRKVPSFLVRHQSFLTSINLVLWKAYFRILLAEPSVILRLNFGKVAICLGGGFHSRRCCVILSLQSHVDGRWCLSSGVST